MNSDRTTTGRPTVYTQELANDICDKIASNSLGLRKLCAENPDWPNRDTIFTWLKSNGDFFDQYARAKRCQIETFIDEILEIADDASNDVDENSQGEPTCNTEFIARSRLRIDTRKWLASKLVPKVYGNKVGENQFDLNARLREELLELRARLDAKYTKDY